MHLYLSKRDLLVSGYVLFISCCSTKGIFSRLVAFPWRQTSPWPYSTNSTWLFIKRLRDYQCLHCVLSCCFLYIYAVLCMFLLLWSCNKWQQLTKYLFDLYFWSCNSKMDQRGMIVLAGNSHPELARAVTK